MVYCSISSEQWAMSMEEMASSAGQISAAVNEVNSISGQNKEIIDNLV
ncbi:MAG: hypothetical protein LBU85_09485 [Treponema sp.]|jgi:methyl-accepting chemotaxis protein|nr:hypothetical protein [Treponema sp.]